MQDNNQQFSSGGSQTDKQIPPITQSLSAGSVDKEKEALKAPELPLEEISEFEPTAEVAKHLLKTKGGIELPPDLKKMDLATPAAAGAVSDMTSTSLSLPLTNEQIVAGLHARILSSFRWLAEWCLRQLKKVHLHLQKIHGHFVRVRD